MSRLGTGARARVMATRALFGGDGQRESCGLGPAAASFRAHLSDPRFITRPHGFSNVRIDVRTGTLTVVPLPVEILMHGSWEPLEYSWPSVVLARLRPFAQTGLLVDVHGSLAYCALLDGARLRGALSTAGFEVIDIERWGIRPRGVQRHEVGERFDRVPGFARAA